MSFIVIIPARFASTRLPKKPLIDLGGQPMVVRVSRRAALSGATHVIVATDHKDIYQACKLNGIDVVMTRTDHFSGTNRVAEVAATLNLNEDAVVVNVQGDEPLISPDLITATASHIKSDILMATAAHPIVSCSKIFNPNIVKVVLDKNKQAIYFSRAVIPWYRDGFARSQENLRNLHHYQPLRHIGLYAYANKFLQIYPTLTVSPLEEFEELEQLRVLWHGYKINVHVTSLLSETGVDTPEDLKRIRKYFL